MTNEELENKIDEHVSKILEHCDSVQILASWNVDSLTKCISRGGGNWYARQGMAREFLLVDEANIIAHKLSEQLKEE